MSREKESKFNPEGFEEKPKTQEKEPEISYHILYGPHRTPTDFEELEEAYNKADVYIPERIGWSPEFLDDLNRLSRGEINLEEIWKRGRVSRNRNSATEKEMEIVYNSKKPILLVDVPEGHKMIETMFENRDLKDEAFDMFKKGEFESAVEKMRDYIVSNANISSKREKLIKENLKEKTENLTETYPELAKKKKINVLLKLGSAHTEIYHDFKKGGFDVSRNFHTMPTTYPFYSEIQRIIKFDKDAKKIDILIARTFIEDLLLRHFQYKIDDSDKKLTIARKLSSKLNVKDIEEISKELGRGVEKSIIGCLKERDIKIPKDEEEMDEMLKIQN